MYPGPTEGNDYIWYLQGATARPYDGIRSRPHTSRNNAFHIPSLFHRIALANGISSYREAWTLQNAQLPP